MPLLLALKEIDFSTLITNITTLRTQTILVCRLLCLYRSHDLANMKRTVSILEGKIPFVKIKRKGQNVLKWERVVMANISSINSQLYNLNYYFNQGNPINNIILGVALERLQDQFGALAYNYKHYTHWRNQYIIYKRNKSTKK